MSRSTIWSDDGGRVSAKVLEHVWTDLDSGTKSIDYSGIVFINEKPHCVNVFYDHDIAIARIEALLMSMRGALEGER